MPDARLDDIATVIREHGVHTVELMVTDTLGHPRGKRFPAQRFIDTVGLKGAHIADAIYVMDVQCDIVDSPFINMGTGFLDMHLVPELHTFRLLKHRPGYATVMAECIDTHHQPHALDPRNVLARQIERVRGLGYDPIAAVELECYICDVDWKPVQSNVQYSSLIDNFPLERCVADMRQALVDLGIPLESSNPEYGPGQLEINFGAGDPMVTADHSQLYKATIKEVARNHGMRATFMPKPFSGQSGSGMHVHTSLNQGGKNVFGPGDGHLLNDVMRHWIGGLITNAAAMSLTGISNGNGYKRVRKYSFCPTHIHWGPENRSVLCRCTLDQGSANRVEYRAAGADANPYLILAAVLTAGADGLERSLDPGPAAFGDQYDDPGDHAVLPATFDEGVEAFRGSALAAALGPEFSANFLSIIDNEVSLYNEHAAGDPETVTDWEFARYVEFA
jgi:glutamine synthetase